MSSACIPEELGNGGEPREAGKLLSGLTHEPARLASLAAG